MAFKVEVAQRRFYSTRKIGFQIKNGTNGNYGWWVPATDDRQTSMQVSGLIAGNNKMLY
jgi:hypothetical protein